MINEAAFKKFLKGISITNYKKVDNSIIVASTQKGRAERKSELQAIKAFFPKAKFVDDGRSGYLEILDGGKKIKIFSKPEKVAGGVILKPNFFKGVTDTEIPMSTYADTLINSIENNSKLDAQQKQLLISLTEYHRKFDATKGANFKKIYSNFKETIPLSTINNDFSELLGPLAVINKKLLPLTMSKTKAFIPDRGNEPLLDYKLISGSDIYKISAKSGDTTNTLKPGDVFSLINAEAALLKRHSKTIQYQVLEILTNNSWKQGPITAVNFLKKNGIKEAKWITSNEYSEPMRQQSENTLVDISKTSLDFTKLYEDATNAKVYYVKFRMDQSGAIKWEILKDSKDRPEVKKRIVFRSKNFVGRPNGDKLGFQPK